MVMTAAELVDAVASALGVDNAVPMTQGGQKIVLSANLAGTPAIVKVVQVQPGPHAAIILERAHREVELLAAIDSPRVVKVLSDAVEIGSPVEAVCWVEELLDGEDLTGLLTSRWSEDEVWPFIWDGANALDACHQLDVVHRDLSPGNVRRRATGRYTLMDPGLARHLTRTAITGTFQPGTQGFRSPEHVPGGNPVPASDVFGLGLLAFYALTGEFAIDPIDPEYERLLTSSQAVSVASSRPDISNELSAIIDRCLQRQPARRYLDGAEMIEAFPPSQRRSE